MEKRSNQFRGLENWSDTALTCISGQSFIFCEQSSQHLLDKLNRIDKGKICFPVVAFAAELVVREALEAELQRQIFPGKFCLAPYELEKSGDCGLDLLYVNQKGLILGGIDVKLGIANRHKQYFNGGIKSMYGIPYFNLYLGGLYLDSNCKEINEKLKIEIIAWIQGGAYPELVPFLAVSQAKRTAAHLLQTLEFNKYTLEEGAMYADFLNIFLSFETPNHLQKI